MKQEFLILDPRLKRAADLCSNQLLFYCQIRPLLVTPKLSITEESREV